MNITPKTEEELSQSMLMPEGVYSFEVTNAEEKISKNGNEMIELKLRIYMPDGSQRVLTDYLLDAMSYKVRHFCDCTGLLDKYNSKKLLAYDCIGKSGKVHVVIQKGRNKPDGGVYPDKNSVKDYEKCGSVPAVHDYSVSGGDDSDIPF